MSDLEAAVSKDLNVQWWSCFILAPVFFGCTNIISYEGPRTKTLPQSPLRCGLSYSPLQVLFASMATHDGEQFCKQRKGVCSQFWRVTGDGESHRGKEFSPPALSKTRCWELVTQVVIHALVSSCSWSSVLLLDEGREWSQQPALNKQGGRGGRRRNCSPTAQWAASRKLRVFSTCIPLAHSSDLAGSSQGCEQTFVLSFLGMGEQRERFVCFLDLTTLSHSKRNNQTSELQKGSGGTGRKISWHRTVNQPTTLRLCQGLPHSPSNLTLVSVCFSWLRGTPCFPYTIKMCGRGSRASTSQCWWLIMLGVGTTLSADSAAPQTPAL